MEKQIKEVTAQFMKDAIPRAYDTMEMADAALAKYDLLFDSLSRIDYGVWPQGPKFQILVDGIPLHTLQRIMKFTAN